MHEHVIGRQQRDFHRARQSDARSPGRRAYERHRSWRRRAIADAEKASRKRRRPSFRASAGGGADASSITTICRPCAYSRRSSRVRWHWPLGARKLPCGQKPAEPAVSGAVPGIGENVGRSVGKDQPRARDDAHRADGFCVLAGENMGAHDAGERIAIGDADARQDQACAACATSSSGCEAPRRNEKFVIVASSAKRGSARIMATSREQPMQEPFRADGLAPVEPLAIEPEAAALRIFGAEIIAGQRIRAPPPFGGDAFGAFDGGDLVEDAAPFEAQGRPVGDFGDRFDQFGPFEQTKRPRRRLRALSVLRQEREPAGFPAAVPCAPATRERRRRRIPGICVSTNCSLRHAARAEPRAQPVDEIGEIALALAFMRLFELPLRRRRAVRRRGRRGARYRCHSRRRFRLRRAHRGVRETACAIVRGSLRGRPAPTLMRRIAPSTRNRRTSNCRPPLAWRSNRAARSRASLRIVPSTSSRREIGLAKRRSAEKSGAAKRGEIAPRSSPQSASRRLITSAPKRAAIGARGRSATSPMRRKPARLKSATVFSSSPSAASGRP